MKPRLFVISGPSGVGKSTLIRRLLREFVDIKFSVSYTTRKPREKEINGKDYFFIEQQSFQTMISQGDFLEWAEYNGNFYGTSKKLIQSYFADNFSCLLEIEIAGAKQIRSIFKHDSVFIFIAPPDIYDLKKRLQKRGTDNSKIIDERFLIAKKEMEESKFFDHTIVNKNIDNSYNELKDIIQKNL